MICIFSKELVVTDGAICPGGGNHISPSKNNYEGPPRQNVYPKMLINDISNIEQTHFMPISNTA